jgi:hypothetical protein
MVGRRSEHAARGFESQVPNTRQRSSVDYVRRAPVKFDTETTVRTREESIGRGAGAAAHGTMARSASLRLCDRDAASVSSDRRVGAQHYQKSRISLRIRQ